MNLWLSAAAERRAEQDSGAADLAALAAPEVQAVLLQALSAAAEALEAEASSLILAEGAEAEMSPPLPMTRLKGEKESISTRLQFLKQLYWAERLPRYGRRTVPRHPEAEAWADSRKTSTAEAVLLLQPVQAALTHPPAAKPALELRIKEKPHL